MLAEDKRGHHSVLPPIGSQVIAKGHVLGRKTQVEVNLRRPITPSLTQTSPLIKHELHECSLAASVCLDVRMCVCATHSSCHRKHEAEICKSNLSFSDSGNDLYLLKTRFPIRNA